MDVRLPAGPGPRHYRAALGRSVRFKGSTVDDVVFWSTFLFPPLALLALPAPTERGYGFDRHLYRDP